MTPLGASLIFILVSIIISAIKYFIFPSNNPTTTQQSSIELKKIYTITDKSTEKRNKSYGSFYEAYHQFHIEEIEERKHKIEENFMRGYNSLVMKKSIINDETVVICQQNYLAVIQQGIICNEQQKLFITSQTHCIWQTTFHIYSLPLLKQTTKQTIKLKGRIITDNNQHSKQFNQKINQLICRKKSQSRFQITFPFMTQTEIWKIDMWRIGRVVIEKVVGDEGKFQLKQQSIQLYDTSHHPSIYSVTNNNLCYTTEQQPWLIRCKSNSTVDWQHINIMQKSIQNKVYQGFSISSHRRSPPFNRIERVSIKHMFLFTSTQMIYNYNHNNCQQSQQILNRRNFVTVVYQHINNPFRVQKFYVQLTFQLNNNYQEINISKITNKEQFHNYQNSKLISSALLISEINPNRIVHSDCQLSKKRKFITERHYEQYYWLYEEKTIAQLEIHSLLCVFRFDIDEHLRIASTLDLIRSQQTHHHYDLSFLDWRNVKKIINYKENFQLYYQKSDNNYSSHVTTITNQNSQQQKLKEKYSIKDIQNQQQQQENQVDIYLEVIRQEILNENYSLQERSDVLQQQQQHKSSIDNSAKNIHQQYYPTTPLSGTHKPTVQTSYNYSFYRQTNTYPIRSEVRKYKFPLPFLLSFTSKMQIINPQPSKPLILFSGVKQYLFTYQLKQTTSQANDSFISKVVDYRYLTLGQTFIHSPKIISQNEGTPQHQIQTSKNIIDQLEKTIDANSNEPINIEIIDETHPEIQNVIKTIHEADEKILNQIKSIKSVPVYERKSKDIGGRFNQSIDSYYQKYLIVVWGWGIEVYMVDWDKNGLFKQNITQQEIEIKLSQKSNSLMEYFLPFIELFATFYCMFQALISSR